MIIILTVCKKAHQFVLHIMTTFTENGATSYEANDPLLKLFYHALRDTPETSMREMVTTAWNGNLSEESMEQLRQRRLLVLRCLFHLRWCRGGKGERKQFLTGMDQLIELGAGDNVLANLREIPHFGYWRDMLHFFGTELEPAMLQIYTNQLCADVGNLQLGGEHLKNVSLAGKWAPSPGKEMDRKHRAVAKFCQRMGLIEAAYRKNYIVPLRKHLRIVETQMCDDDWENINYEHVPSLARLKYNSAFQKHDPTRFAAYMTAVAEGKAKMNIKLVFPYQLVQAFVDGTTDETSLNVMWDELVRQTREKLLGDNSNAERLQGLAVADLSGSMTFPNNVPWLNAVALSLLWSELCEGRFKGHCYVFSRTATLLKIEGATFCERVHFMQRYSEIANTNLQAVFNDMLTHATAWSVPRNLYPKRLYIFTDGQFDTMTNGSSVSNLEETERKHHRAGYPLPEIVFWNLRGDIVDFPAPGDRRGVAMVSGFSDSLLQLLLTGKPLNPVSLMLDALDTPELQRVKLADDVCLCELQDAIGCNVPNCIWKQ